MGTVGKAVFGCGGLAVPLGLLLVACGPRAELCNGSPCVANAECVELEQGEECRCRSGFVDRAGRCQPEGPCGRLAGVLCDAVGRRDATCALLREGVATADGAACERRMEEGELGEGVEWIGEVEPMLERGLPPVYRAFLTRSLLDPCGAATELLCSVMRPGEEGCGAEAAALTRDERSCRAVLKGYDGALPEPTGAGAEPTGAGTVGEDVLVHLIPDPGNAGAMPGSLFRSALTEKRVEIQACYDGARGSFPGLAGRAVYLVHVDPAGLVTVELGRGDGPIVGSGVAECVLHVLLMLDFASAPPTGGEFAVHVSFDFGQ